MFSEAKKCERKPFNFLSHSNKIIIIRIYFKTRSKNGI